MLYQKFAPSVFLGPFVETFYVWEGLFPNSFTVESPPNGHTSMVFNYGSVYDVLNRKGQIDTVPQAFLTGQATRRYQLHLNGKLGVIGIVFKPAALHTIFGLQMFEFSDERTDLSDIMGKEMVFLHEQILEASNSYERVNLLNQFLTRKVLQSKKSFDRTDYIANLIQAKHGLAPLQDLSKELYVCSRQFQRQFLNKVGVSAKYYSRIARMSHLCAGMARNKWSVNDWHQLIYMYGYYDQSHFIKEFTEFMGKVPSAYLKHNLELGNYLNIT